MDRGVKPARHDRGRGRPYVIGLTGNIATGKSAVMEALRDLGVEVIDADTVAHELMRPGAPAFGRVVRAFGRNILDPDGAIDRRELGRIVFADKEAMARLDAAVHPAVARRLRAILADSRLAVVAVEAIKLIESGLTRLCDALWVVTCSREQQIERLMARSGLSEAEAAQRVDAQSEQGKKLAVADVIIDNGGTLESTRQQVERHWREIGLRGEASTDDADGHAG